MGIVIWIVPLPHVGKARMCGYWYKFTTPIGKTSPWTGGKQTVSANKTMNDFFHEWMEQKEGTRDDCRKTSFQKPGPVRSEICQQWLNTDDVGVCWRMKGHVNQHFARTTGPPDRHRRAARAGNAGKCPMFLYLSLISYSKLASWHHSQFS